MRGESLFLLLLFTMLILLVDRTLASFFIAAKLLFSGAP